jgi:hypothetical protein
MYALPPELRPSWTIPSGIAPGREREGGREREREREKEREMRERPT